VLLLLLLLEQASEFLVKGQGHLEREQQEWGRGQR
jgi:hypothetical protein